MIECLEQNIRKPVDCKRPLCAKQMGSVQNIGIEICKKKCNQVRLVLVVFASSKLITRATFDFKKHLTIN